MGLRAKQQNGDEGAAKRGKYLDGGARNVWFGYCVVHMFTYGRSGYLTIDRCRSARRWRVGHYNGDLRRPDPTRPVTGWFVTSLLRYFIVHCWWAWCWSMDGAPTAPRVVANVGARHQVAGPLVLPFEEVVKSEVGGGVSNGAVVDAQPNYHIWRVLDFILAPTLVGTGAYFDSLDP